MIQMEPTERQNSNLHKWNSLWSAAFYCLKASGSFWMCSCSVSSIRQVPRLLDQTVVAHIDPLHTYAYIYTHKYTCVACHTQSYCICIRTCIKYKKSIEPITSSRPRFASSWVILQVVTGCQSPFASQHVLSSVGCLYFCWLKYPQLVGIPFFFLHIPMSLGSPFFCEILSCGPQAIYEVCNTRITSIIDNYSIVIT